MKPSKDVSDERMQGLLENVFCLKLPAPKSAFETPAEQKFAGVLENVFGLKLPTELVTSAYTIS